MNAGGFTVSALTLGLGITMATDLIRNTALGRRYRTATWLWNAVPIAIGLGVALGLGLDLAPSTINVGGVIRHVGFWQGCVATGVALGGAAAGHHGWLDFLSTVKAARASDAASGEAEVDALA